MTRIYGKRGVVEEVVETMTCYILPEWCDSEREKKSLFDIIWIDRDIARITPHESSFIIKPEQDVKVDWLVLNL